MATDDTGPWGNPRFLGAGAPDVAVDPNDVSDYFVDKSIREFATQALLNAATGHQVGYLARVRTIRGAIFTATSTSAGAWEMSGIPKFADAAARSAAITVPADNMFSIRADADYIEQYVSGAWRPLSGLLYCRQEATGTLTATTWVTRIFNNAVINEISGASLNTTTGVISLTAGTYEVNGHASAFACNAHQTRLRQTSGTPATLLAGSTGAADATVSQGVTSDSFIFGRFTIAVTTDVALQHWVSTTRATNGQGVTTASGETQILAELTIRRIS